MFEKPALVVAFLREAPPTIRRREGGGYRTIGNYLWRVSMRGRQVRMIGSPAYGSARRI
jgi:hypothetical protein